MRAARAVAMAGVGMALVLGPVGPAYAAPAETTTTTVHRVTETFEDPDVVPCLGEGEDAPLAVITVTYNAVEHTTVKGEALHETFTQTGTFRAVYEDERLGTSSGR